MSSWKIYKETNIYFLTSTIIEWMPVFMDKDFFDIIVNSLRYCSDNKGLKIHGFVIMLNHIHLLVSTENNLSGIMRDFKGFTSSEIVRLLQRKKHTEFLKVFKRAASKEFGNQHFKVWQSGYHPIGIETEKFYLQKLNYIHENPVKKGYVIKPEYWLYSSASQYAGHKNCLLEIVML